MAMGLFLLVIALGAIGWSARFGIDTRSDSRTGWSFDHQTAVAPKY